MLVCVWYVVALMLVFPLCCLLLVNCYLLFLCFFFFQAEDGIRDRDVTGVHTCALPISRRPHRRPPLGAQPRQAPLKTRTGCKEPGIARLPTPRTEVVPARSPCLPCRPCRRRQIGRASCRERV